MTRQRAIYLKCLDCSGCSPKEVTLCQIFDCPLWEFRCGYHISSVRYQERIKTAFSKNTEDIRELRRDGLDMADFLLEHKHACVFSGKGKEKKAKDQKEEGRVLQGARA